jgi:hypothetical protein
MFDISIDRSAPVLNLLDHFQAKITIIVPLASLKVGLSVFAALIVVFLMQANTRHAGFGNPIRLIRLVQRFSMAVLAIALILVAGVSATGARQFDDLLMILVFAPMMVMLLCSALVGWYFRRHPTTGEIERAHIDEPRRAPIR